tara:strand:- start:1082 stop:1375 length:294 start_codon:yes stop_codon:yes gene_type:complete
MWDQVKPITLTIEQKNIDNSKFILHFYSCDYEVVKLREAIHVSEFGDTLGFFSRLASKHDEKYFISANFFIGKLSKDTTSKLIQYFENPNLFIEYYC